MQSIEDMATAVQDVFMGLFQELRICQIGFSG